MNYRLLIFFTLLALTACSGKKGEMRIRGEINGLEEADLFVFSLDGGTEGIDTIHIHEGQFDWHTTCTQDEATFQIVWPGNTNLTVFGGSGQVADIKGDAHSLGRITVEGSDDNEKYTEIRLAEDSLPKVKVDSIIDVYTAANPESQLTRFIKKQRSLQETPIMLRVGQKMPSYTLKMLSGKTLGSLSLRGRNILFVFWAGWTGSYMEVAEHMREALKPSETLEPSETGRRPLNRASGAMVCISYSLDVNPLALNNMPQYPDVHWETFCDRLAFQSPLVSRLGIRQLPYYILVGKDGRITASSSDWTAVKEKLPQ